MKLEFYKPKLEEYDNYKSYYTKCMQLCSESSFWAIWDMVDTMQARRAFDGEFYWHKVVWHDKNLWMPPIGDWDNANWETVLTNSVPKGTVFGYMPEYLVNSWVKSFPAKLGILEPMDGESDYIYHIDRQIALKGSHYSSIRGGIRKFEREYGAKAEFREFSVQDIPAIKSFQKWWMQENYKLGKMSADLEIEDQMVVRMLDNWGAMRDMTGAVLFIDGQVVAYVTVAELDTYIAEGHILKADYSYSGIYQYMIDKVYNILLKDYTIFNAWGDGGVEGLRQSKLAQNPLTILRKYIISWEG